LQGALADSSQFDLHLDQMENPEQNGYSNPRMDRLEKLMDLLITDHLTFSDEHKKLLTAQVVLTDTVQKLGEAQKHTEERLNALITVVDGLIRNRPSL
jgi:hypothetical protein